MPHRRPEDVDALGEELLGKLAEGLPPAELATTQRASMRARVMARALDAPPPDSETIRGEDVPWREAWPKVWVKVLKRDPAADIQITLMRFEPGGRIPAHLHRKDEECYVLQGEVTVGSHCVRAGDFHVAHAGGHHPDLISRTGALVMLRSEHHP
jgi:quercetin dioxygenase-like cupin family protein